MPTQLCGTVTLAGRPLTLVGEPVAVGQPAPDFVAVDEALDEWRFSEKTQGRIRLVSVVPSLDTAPCNLQTRRFEQELARRADQVLAITVSMDLPFAQARWKAEVGAQHLVFVSDHRYAAFGLAYGTLLKELRLDTRAVFVIDAAGRVTHAQYPPEITEQPDFASALRALDACVGAD